jgi:hypothetical protein
VARGEALVDEAITTITSICPGPRCLSLVLHCHCRAPPSSTWRGMIRCYRTQIGSYSAGSPGQQAACDLGTQEDDPNSRGPKILRGREGSFIALSSTPQLAEQSRRCPNLHGT